MPDLAQYGWDESLERDFRALGLPDTVPGRIAVDYGQNYLVVTEAGDVRADMSGRYRLAVKKGEALKPAVGDWVAVEKVGDGQAILHAVLPRRSKLSRKVAGRATEEQVVAANVDTVFLVTAANVEVNLRKLERNLTLAWESGARPVLVFTKADLCDDPAAVEAAARSIAGKAPVYLVSNATGAGLEDLRAELQPGRTVVLVGVSGVGKSSLVNAWLGYERQATGAVREQDQKGRHTTTHRELFVLPGGALVIDTPGVRELALWEGEQGIAEAFPDVVELAKGCRFGDCRHEKEPGCAVQAAVAEGALSAERYAAYRKLAAELAEMERLQAERARTTARRAARPPPRKR